ncbi:MAG: DNA/RNA-binding protein AlbA [Candidatus Heimdallarchaeaceae archaeon]
MSKNDSQTIFIGKKPTINYVLVAVTVLNQEGTCVIQARGRQISKAVDVAEITRRKFLQNLVEVQSVAIGSEELVNEENPDNPKTVSTIEIVLVKK